MIFSTALGKFETTVAALVTSGSWEWFCHGNCRNGLSHPLHFLSHCPPAKYNKKLTVPKYLPPPQPVRGLMTVILIFTRGILDTLMCHLTVSRASCAHVVTNTDKMTSDTMRSNIPMSSVFVVVWGKMPRSKDCTGFQNYYYKQIWSFRSR